MKNPYLNAIGASVYIALVVLVIGNVEHSGKPDIVNGITMISLFTLSAGVMFYLFVFHPLQLFLENKKQEAVTFFLKILGTFGAITIGFILFLLS